MRYDIFVAKRLNLSRNKALELIENEEILLNSKPYKASFDVQNLLKNKIADQEELLNSKELNLELLGELYVSRAAFKLKYFLENHNINIANKTCLDIGSSTGGFVQILLEHKALKVSALDVGDNQLHPSLRDDERIEVIENTDLRTFKSEQKFDFITCDVSFISLTHLLSYIDNLALKDIVLLFKPQFEVGKQAKRDKKGVLKDEKAVLKAMREFENACARLGWILQCCEESKIKGKEGNIEYFYYYTKK
ncbi:TPA: TlyA family RNA methyltransferase [Campylobacter coli]|nr:TlyA family RNA methyltransferase [Campylobacter coli]ELK4666672.1 TlyA family RNA methyltransferase [Campylobacter coli]HEA8164553.1 TlyA family RNA methyltransferase [Campylobacter coli]HED6631739.1 TlyA family RNA methyltransferase [Campylobacter coli]HEH4506256.1 TlyA family RNA methyltransferase [Campylobacter coli]